MTLPLYFIIYLILKMPNPNPVLMVKSIIFQLLAQKGQHFSANCSENTRKLCILLTKVGPEEASWPIVEKLFDGFPAKLEANVYVAER